MYCSGFITKKKLVYLLCLMTVCAHAQLLNTSKLTIESRYTAPKGYYRIKLPGNSFGTYLRNLPLKPYGSLVHHYDGTTKANDHIYSSVIDLPIGKRDLHQCADAVMRLRAEYLWKNKQHDKIKFRFGNGFLADYNSWKAGNRIRVKGNKAYWVKLAKPSASYSTFWKYMEMVFAYAGSLSLSKELKKVKLNQLQIGDVFIKGGSPGHTAIVMDVVVNPTSKEKLFLLAQSFMSAQETHVLVNRNDTTLGSWYKADFGGFLSTPEYTFESDQLMRFH